MDIRVTGAAEEDKTVRIEVELHALDKVLEGATEVYMRIFSEVGTYKDVSLHPNGVFRGRPATVLSGGFTLSKFAKAGYWFPGQVQIRDPAGNERFERGGDFGWSLYVNNPLEDVTPPRYVRNSASLKKYTRQLEGREVQIIEGTWEVEEDTSIVDCAMNLTVDVRDTYSFRAGLDFPYEFDPQVSLCRAWLIAPDYIPSGVYTLVHIDMRDVAGNFSSFQFGDTSEPSTYETPPTIELITGDPDLEAPQVDLNTIRISAEPTNPSAPNGETRVTLSFSVRDNISGFVLASADLRDPQGIDHQFYVYAPDRSNRFPPGDPSEWTTYDWTIILPEGSAPGTWGLAQMTVRDRARNFRQYDFAEIIHFDVESD